MARGLADVARARRTTAWPVNLFGVVVDEGLHAHGADVKRIAGISVGRPTTRLRRSTNTAAAAAHTGRKAWRRHGREVCLRRARRATMGRGHGALAGKAADSMQGRGSRGRVAALARMDIVVGGESRNVWCVRRHRVNVLEAVGWKLGHGCTGEGSLWHRARTALGHADGVANGVSS